MTSRNLFIALCVLAFFGCARQTTPTGGPQDKTPPVLMRSIPANNEINYKGKTITLIFDEDLKLKDPKEEIIIAPSLGKDVLFSVKQNRVTITPKIPLKDSTTYSFLFREGIQDITEGNSPENSHLAFSTGSILDSLRIGGMVTNALDEKTPDNITVAIYSSDTFNIFKHTPLYFTKVNKLGQFQIQNLKPGLYKIYAFEDKNKNLKLETKTEKFGFLPGKITLTHHIDSLVIPLINMDARPLSLTNVRHNKKISRAVFNKGLSTYTAIAKDTIMPSSFGDSRAEIEFFHYQPIHDSIAVALHAIDSIDQAIDTVIHIKTGTSPPVPEVFKPEIQKAKVNFDPPAFSAEIVFNKPIAQIIMDSLQIKLDTIKYLPITAKDLTYDSAQNTLTLSHPFTKRTYDSLPLDISFYAGKAAFISIDKDSSKQIVTSYAVPQADELASIALEIKTTQKSYIIQLLTKDYEVLLSSTNKQSIVWKNVPPAAYKIRVVIDTNGNGRWDPGNITKDIPPEQTIFQKNSADGKYNFPLRANWEVGPYTFQF